MPAPAGIEMDTTGDRPISLSSLQTRLQSVYEIDLEHHVDDYLITNKALASTLDRGRSSAYAREKLLVHEDEEGLNLSLYIDAGVLDQFDRKDPLEQLDATNLQEFCLVIEGISHFIYLTWNASHDRSVTLLEMELQAEIDKYIMLMYCLDRQENPPQRGQLSRLLFESGSYHPDLGHEESRRYYVANACARRYCRRLEARFGVLRDRKGLLAELRRFYRLGQRDKLRRILQPH